jgi:hypothetical protein
MSFLVERCLVSRGSAALVSATAVAPADDDEAVKGGAGAKAGGESSSGVSQGLLRGSTASRGGK